MYEHFVVRYIITQMADNNIEINSGNKNKDLHEDICSYKYKIFIFL